jgi:plastocyanin
MAVGSQVVVARKPADDDAQEGVKEDAKKASKEDTKKAPEKDAKKSAEDKIGVSGVVKFLGPRPRRKPLRLGQGQKGKSACAKLHKTPPLDEEAIVGKKGELANVFVYVSKGLAKRKKYPAPKKPAVLDQLGCTFRPHVQGVQVGQIVHFKNSDALLHNVRSYARRNRAFNMGQPAGSEIRERVFRRPEMAMKIQCDVHKWMTAYIHILEHPFFAVTGADGKFDVKGLAAGEYTLTAWHELYGEQKAKVTVGASGKAKVDFTFKPKP